MTTSSFFRAHLLPTVNARREAHQRSSTWKQLGSHKKGRGWCSSLGKHQCQGALQSRLQTTLSGPALSPLSSAWPYSQTRIPRAGNTGPPRLLLGYILQREALTRSASRSPRIKASHPSALSHATPRATRCQTGPQRKNRGEGAWKTVKAEQDREKSPELQGEIQSPQRTCSLAGEESPGHKNKTQNWRGLSPKPSRVWAELGGGAGCKCEGRRGVGWGGGSRDVGTVQRPACRDRATTAGPVP